MKIVIESKVCGPHHIKGIDHEPEGDPVVLVGGFSIDVCNAVRTDMERLVKNVRAMADIPEEYDGTEEATEPSKSTRTTARKARGSAGTNPAKVTGEINQNK